jgi:hypothetical protein
MNSKQSFPHSAAYGPGNGRPLICNLSSIGSIPEPGEYEVTETHDPVYGKLAVLAPSQDGPVQRKNVAEVKYQSSMLQPGASRDKFGGQTTGKRAWGSMNSSLSATSHSYVLSSKPLAGRNCVVTTSGLSELHSELQKTGKVKVLISSSFLRRLS